MNYQDYQRMSKQAAEKAFASNEVKCICEAMVSIAFYEPDWKWVQNKCLGFLNNEKPEIRGLAATCLGHIARIHRQLEKEKVLNALHGLLDDHAISGQVKDALDDIDMFLQ